MVQTSSRRQQRHPRQGRDRGHRRDRVLLDSGRSELQLASEAIKSACDDAGIAPQDIDGLVRYDMESNHETLLTQSLGIRNLRHWESVSYGGGAGNATIGHAAAAIAAGYANYVVCFRAANLRSGMRLGRARGPEKITGGAQGFAAPWGCMAPPTISACSSAATCTNTGPAAVTSAGSP